jgi:hypothetical protein
LVILQEKKQAKEKTLSLYSLVYVEKYGISNKS